MPGFLDGSDALITLGLGMSGVGQGKGLGQAIEYADRIAERNRQERIVDDSRGFLGDVLEGTDPGVAAKRYRHASPELLNGFIANKLSEERAARTRTQGVQDEIAREGRQQALQADDEARARAAKAVAAGEALRGRGFIQQAISQGIPPEAVDGAEAQGPPRRLGLDEVTPDMMDAFGGVSPEGFIGGMGMLEQSQAREALTAGREARAEAVIAKQALDRDKAAHTTGFAGELAKYGNDLSKVPPEVFDLYPYANLPAAQSAARALLQAGTSLERTDRVIAGQGTRQEDQQEFTGGENTKDRALRRGEGAANREAAATRSTGAVRPEKPPTVQNLTKLIGGGRKDLHQIKVNVQADPKYADTVRGQLEAEMLDAKAWPQLRGETPEAWTARIQRRLREIKAFKGQVGW